MSSRALSIRDLLRQAERALASRQFPEAEQLCRKVMNARPLDADARHLFGLIAVGRGDVNEAETRLRGALRLAPGAAAIWNSLGNVQDERGQPAEALASFDQAIGIDPTQAEFHANRGRALAALGRHREALGSCDRALALKPDHAGAHSGRGTILRELGRGEEALAACDAALKLAPGQPGFHNNRGIALQALGRHAESVAAFETAVRISPDYADARLGLAMALLRLGRFREGWATYEWRWRTSDFGPMRAFGRRQWDGGKSVDGKTILIHAEQGFGDTIQFCRYLPMLRAAGARIVLEAPKTLVELLGSLDAEATIIVRGEPWPAFDLHCPVMSLPGAFRTESGSIPSATPYLSAVERLVARWSERLRPGDRPRIGVAWSGRPTHGNDRNRSIALRDFAAILRGGGGFHSLQREIRPLDEPALAALPDLVHFGEELRDFSDTAALVQGLDLVITVDTAVAHLAGALGKPVWILLPFTPDWRWQLDRSDSPWYPTARLFRQRQPGNWNDVLSDVARALAEQPPPSARDASSCAPP